MVMELITEVNDLNKNKNIVPDIKSIWNGSKIIGMRAIILKREKNNTNMLRM